VTSEMAGGRPEVWNKLCEKCQDSLLESWKWETRICFSISAHWNPVF